MVGIPACETVMQRCTETIQVGAWIGLRGTMLFWWCIARRTQKHSILLLAFFEETCNAKINQVDVSVGSDHHIGWFEIAENDGGTLLVEVGENITQLACIIQDLQDRQWTVT